MTWNHDAEVSDLKCFSEKLHRFVKSVLQFPLSSSALPWPPPALSFIFNNSPSSPETPQVWPHTDSPMSPSENVALRGKATQLRRYAHDFGAAYNAIDGNRESWFHMGSCTHSAELIDPWWRVDLLRAYVVTSISITNRGDCCEHRLDELNIHIGNSTTTSGLDNPL